jgi:acyl carrier protein
MPSLVDNYEIVYSEIKKALVAVNNSEATKINALNISDSLIEAGVIDSLGMIELISTIEEKFKIILDADDINSQNFESIKNIGSLILKKKNYIP